MKQLYKNRVGSLEKRQPVTLRVIYTDESGVEHTITAEEAIRKGGFEQFIGRARLTGNDLSALRRLLATIESCID